MIIDEFILTSVLGRSGTTLVRNMLGKYENICCLTTNKQEELYGALDESVKMHTHLLGKHISHDIKTQFSHNKPIVNNINKMVYKTPITNVLFYGTQKLLKRFKPVLVVRNPVDTVLSASSEEFVKISCSRKQVIEMLLTGYKKIGLTCPVEYLKDIEKSKSNLVMTNAAIYKIGLFLHKHYFNEVYQQDFMLLVFEEFLQSPTRVMGQLLAYMGSDLADDYIFAKLQESYYTDALEEGGILMSQNINPNKTINRKTDSKEAERLSLYLEEEACALFYSKDTGGHGASQILTRL